MITIDRREITEHPDIPQLLTVPHRIDTLDSGDYAFVDRTDGPVGIERSEIGNLVQKLHSGELEQQLARCANQYQSVVLLAEGVWDEVAGLLATYKQGEKSYFRTRVYPTTQYLPTLALLSRLSELGIEIVQTPNFTCSMLAIRAIYNQRTKLDTQQTLFRRTRAIWIPPKLTANPAVPRLLALCPRMPERVAIALMIKYTSIWNILNTPDQELLQIDGLGTTLLRRLRDNVGYLQGGNYVNSTTTTS